MNLFITGMIIFFAVHSISIVNDDWRNRMAAAMGEWIWKGLYSVFAIVGLVLIIKGYGEARLQEPLVLYTPPAGMQALTIVLMIPVFPLLFATYLPGRIQAASKHPMLIAVKLWALSHLLSNGALIDVVLFGGFLAWAVVDRISLKRRQPNPPPRVPESPVNDLLAIVLGLVLYGVFMYKLHPMLIGIPVIGSGT